MSTNKDANNNKRKRCDDDDNSGDGCDKDNIPHHDENKNTNNEETDDVKPDAILSSTSSNIIFDLELPQSGEFPTIDQLVEIMDFIAAPCNDDDRSRLDSILKALEYLKDSCGNYAAPLEAHKIFETSFVDIGCPLRLIFLIKKHMGNAAIVKATADVLFWSTSRAYKPREPLRYDELRYLHLTTEELIPSNNEVNWKAAVAVWKLISDLVLKTDAFKDSDKIIRFLEVDAKFLKTSPNNFLAEKIEISGCLAKIATYALDFHSDNKDIVDIIQHNKMYHDILVFCLDNASIWVEHYHAWVLPVLELCRMFVANDLIPSTELLTTVVPLASKANFFLL